MAPRPPAMQVPNATTRLGEVVAAMDAMRAIASLDAAESARGSAPASLRGGDADSQPPSPMGLSVASSMAESSIATSLAPSVVQASARAQELWGVARAAMKVRHPRRSSPTFVPGPFVPAPFTHDWAPLHRSQFLHAGRPAAQADDKRKVQVRLSVCALMRTAVRGLGHNRGDADVPQLTRLHYAGACNRA